MASPLTGTMRRLVTLTSSSSDAEDEADDVVSSLTSLSSDGKPPGQQFRQLAW